MLSRTLLVRAPKHIIVCGAGPSASYRHAAGLVTLDAVSIDAAAPEAARSHALHERSREHDPVALLAAG